MTCRQRRQGNHSAARRGQPWDPEPHPRSVPAMRSRFATPASFLFSIEASILLSENGRFTAASHRLSLTKWSPKEEPCRAISCPPEESVRLADAGAALRGAPSKSSVPCHVPASAADWARRLTREGAELDREMRRGMPGEASRLTPPKPPKALAPPLAVFPASPPPAPPPAAQFEASRLSGDGPMECPAAAVTPALGGGVGSFSGGGGLEGARSSPVLPRTASPEGEGRVTSSLTRWTMALLPIPRMPPSPGASNCCRSPS